MESFDPFVTFILGVFTGAICVGLIQWIDTRYERKHGLGRPAKLIKPPALTKYPGQPERIAELRKILDEEMQENRP